jgi:hypothetical protein
MTYADVLGPMHPDVAALMRVTANRMGTEPPGLSADKGVMHTMATWGSRRANVVGGTGELTEAIAAGLGSRIVTNAVARTVTQSASEVTVEAVVDGRLQRFTAATCIVTVPAPIAREIVDGLSPEKDAALGQIRYGPYVVAGIFTAESGLMRGTTSTPWPSRRVRSRWPSTLRTLKGSTIRIMPPIDTRGSGRRARPFVRPAG